MTEEHPNIPLLKRPDLRNLAAAKGVIAEVRDIVPGEPTTEKNDARH